MPNTKSAARRMRSSARKHLHNNAAKSELKTLEEKFLADIKAANKADAAAAMNRVVSALDKAAKSGTIHKAKADRKKSRLAAHLAKLK